MLNSRGITSHALRQAILLAIIAAALGLTANFFNPRGVAIGLAAPPAVIGGLSWNNAAAADAPRAIALAELHQLMQRGQALLIDARSGDDYRSGHLPGAVSLPWEHFFELVDRVHSFPKDKWLICYCDGGTCELSNHLAHELLLRGFTGVAVYSGGIEEWQMSNKLESGEEASRE